MINRITREILDLYASDDSRVMGYLYEDCTKYAKKYYDVNISRDKFARKFVYSNIRWEMDNCSPRALNNSAIGVFIDYVNYDLHGDFTPVLAEPDEEDDYYPDELRWIGQMYAYIRYKNMLTIPEIYEKIDLDLMRQIYVWGHQMSMSGAYERIFRVTDIRFEKKG